MLDLSRGWGFEPLWFSQPPGFHWFDPLWFCQKSSVLVPPQMEPWFCKQIVLHLQANIHHSNTEQFKWLFWNFRLLQKFLTISKSTLNSVPLSLCFDVFFPFDWSKLLVSSTNWPSSRARLSKMLLIVGCRPLYKTYSVHLQKKLNKTTIKREGMDFRKFHYVSPLLCPNIVIHISFE